MLDSGGKKHGRLFGDRWQRFLVALVLLAGILPVAAQEEDRRSDAFIGEDWERIGGFKGSTSSRLWQRVNDLLFEEEAGGSLYRDLGDVSLGLGYGTDNLEADWDNSFYRRVLPLQRDIPPGGLVTGDDLSGYIDLQTLVSRGRLSYNLVPDILEDLGGIGMRVEGGAGLTLGRIHKPLMLGNRPLDEALADPDRLLDRLSRDRAVEGDRSLLRLGTEGIAGFVRWIAGHIGRGVADTERSAIFYQYYADTITLFIDLGIPVEAKLFTAGDSRLGPGDLVRHVTFLGLAPLNVGLKKAGMKASYQHFYRFFRETTIVKEGGGRVRVQVRTALARGNELTPLKIRPELRILGILKLGYTFFEQIYGNAHNTTYDVIYRIDLNEERGMACFKSLLGDGTRVQLRPLAEAAAERDGAVILNTEARQGGDRFSYERTRFFSLFRRKDRRTASSDIVTTGDAVRREIVRTRNWTFKKGFGHRQYRHKKFYVRSQSDLRHLDGDSPLQRERDAGEDPENRFVAVTLLNSVRDDHATGVQVRRMAGILSRAIDWESHPVLEELVTVDPELSTRLFVNLRLSLNGKHIARLAAATEDEVWTELAHLLLGAEHRDAWSSAEKRRRWKGAARRRRAAEAPPVFDDLGLEARAMSPRALYRLARRSVRRFQRVQALARDPDCLRCLSRSFDSWLDITMMQTLMIRLGRLDGGSDIGFHYEVFIDEMLRPVTVTNGVVYEYPSRLGIIDVMQDAVAGPRGRTEKVEDLELEHSREGRQWQGESFAEPSSSRLKGGNLLVNAGAETPPGAPPEPCWKLRLYSDVYFAGDLSLRIDLRKAGGIKADTPFGFSHFSLGAPTAVEETPFMMARLYYDIPLPAVERLEGGKAYVLLLRVINAEGLPVSEEQQVRFTWPTDGLQRAAAGCFSPPLAD